MSNETISLFATALLKQFKGYTVIYVKDILKEATQQVDSCSFVFPYEVTKKVNPSDSLFMASVLEEVSQLRPEWFGEGSSLSECLAQVRREALALEEAQSCSASC